MCGPPLFIQSLVTQRASDRENDLGVFGKKETAEGKGTCCNENKRTLKITAKEGARKPTHVTGETLVILHQLLKFLINFENFADSVGSDLDLLID